MTGQRAKIAPFATESSASDSGICHTATATINATISPASAACQAGRRNRPNRTSTATIGKIATRKERIRLPPTGVRSCANMGHTLRRMLWISLGPTVNGNDGRVLETMAVPWGVAPILARTCRSQRPVPGGGGERLVLPHWWASLSSSGRINPCFVSVWLPTCVCNKILREWSRYRCQRHSAESGGVASTRLDAISLVPSSDPVSISGDSSLIAPLRCTYPLVWFVDCACAPATL